MVQDDLQAQDDEIFCHPVMYTFTDFRERMTHQNQILGSILGVVRRRQWHPTPVFLPGESQGRGSPVGCRLWGRTESDTTEAT